MGFDVGDLTRLVRTKILVCDCGCWYWQGSCDTSGYPKFKLRNRTIQVHRYAYERLVADIPDDLTIDHLSCTSRRCCNPAHMQVVTRNENSTRANATRWHDLKFDADGNAHRHEHCRACLDRDNQSRLMGYGSHPEMVPRSESLDAFAEPL